MGQHARWLRITVWAVLVVALLYGGGQAFQLVEKWKENPGKISHHTDEEKPRTELVPDRPGTLQVPADVATMLGLTTKAVEQAPPPAPLRLAGSLFLDPNRLTHVHTRFAGEIVDVGVPEFDRFEHKARQKDDRTLRFGDRVKKGDLLAVVWSKDLGEKKSELLDAVSRHTLDRETLQRLEKLWAEGAVPERSVREQERLVESDLIAVGRAERTLRTWRVSDEDIAEIRSEAARLHKNRIENDNRDMRTTWARVEIRSPIEGVVVEKNFSLGDVVSDQLDLFKIADLSRLSVLAHAYEDDLVALEELTPAQRIWFIQLQSGSQTKPLRGSFDQIGRLIDPNQHTALVMGWVDNAEGRLRGGQFVTATVELPADPNEVSIPMSSMVDEEGQTYIFVQTDTQQPRYTIRRVLPVHRRDLNVYVPAKLTAEQLAAGYEPLKAGEIVVTSGCLELARELRDLQAAAEVRRGTDTKVENRQRAAGKVDIGHEVAGK